MFFSWLKQCWGVRPKPPEPCTLPLPGSDGDCLDANDVEHVERIYTVYSGGALIKVQTKLGEKKLGCCSPEELRWMPGAKAAIAKDGIDIPPGDSICRYDTYRYPTSTLVADSLIAFSRELVDDSTAVDLVEMYEGIELVEGGSYFVWAVISRGGERVRVIFRSIRGYLQCKGAIAAIPRREPAHVRTIPEDGG
ncbi:hypothetical protein TEQG_08084 [Trichophyton equinum CBS 127.97]|uniref:Uncharacterized protein n=1 Tax=Trichophyton equinum (strain ATCC MYA-4606 / CBS 127.97) TaxID=559882 RepID=F2Q4I8_TRIEC|nr:hypothetical protein TEQG_08084 [Trichophyton equinum CBS 127.97]